MTAVNARQNAIVGSWLLVCCALVFAMVMLGGVTRLTGSGLSMVEWRPVTGILPPLSEAEWQQAFAAYQQSPEFRKINHAMDVHAFKEIFWLEYLHRLLGRLIGLVFFVPMAFFFWRGTIPAAAWPKYLGMFLLGGLQGLLGWYMVKSGLIDNPHVSQYRLTAHLAAAFAIYAYMLWIALGLFYRDRDGPPHRWFTRGMALTGMIALTIASGGFVAGLKAGYAYNTFPLMGGEWIPPGLLTFEPVWRNFFDNVVTVQFDHRVLAITTFSLIAWFWFAARKAGLPRRARLASHAMLAAATAQVTLGISTLVLHVPLVLAAAHQATALILFTTALVTLHALRGNPLRRAI